MSLIARVHSQLQESASTTLQAADAIAPAIAAGADAITQCLLNGKKVLTCGNGPCAANAQHFASALLTQFEMERPSLPAICLTADSATVTAIANYYEFQDIFTKQIRALGKDGDLLVIISTSGRSPNILNAIAAAHERGMTVIALTGRDGGDVAKRLTERDVEIRINSDGTARILEMHLLALHCLCDLLDMQLFGQRT